MKGFVVQIDSLNTINKELRAEKEKAELEANKKYQNFLEKSKDNPKSDSIQNDGKEVRLYRLVSTLKL